MALDLTCLHDRQAKSSAAHLSARSGARRVATLPPSHLARGGRVAVLHDEPAADALVLERRVRGIEPRPGREQAQVLLCAEHGERRRVEPRRDDALEERLREELGRRVVDVAVQGDDPSERADRVGLAGPRYASASVAADARRRTGSCA